MKKTKLENQQQVWKGCKKQPVRQQAWHIPKIWSAAYRHTGRNLCKFLLKKMKPKNEAYNIPRIEKSDCTIK